MTDYDRTGIPARYDCGRDHGPEMVDLWMEATVAQVDQRPRRILDLGCGTGRFSDALAVRFGAEVVGVDPSFKMIERALRKPRSGRVYYQLDEAISEPIDLFVFRARSGALSRRCRGDTAVRHRNDSGDRRLAAADAIPAASRLKRHDIHPVNPVKLEIPRRLVESCASVPERVAWLDRLPSLVTGLQRRWSLSIYEPFEASCGWVAPAVRADGTEAVIKISMPHFEAEHEIQGLRFWSGSPTVRLLEADADSAAMLLERCNPGTSLRSVSEHNQDRIIAKLLRSLWRVPPTPNEFRPLSSMVDHWCDETRADSACWPDATLVEEGLQAFEDLAASDDHRVLLATDLHSGNVLRAEREPWLVIDPKPFIGDPAYDATQHLLNCRARVQADPQGTVTRFAELLDVDPERVRLWLFAHVAAEPRDVWDANGMVLARLLRG